MVCPQICECGRHGMQNMMCSQICEGGRHVRAAGSAVQAGHEGVHAPGQGRVHVPRQRQSAGTCDV